MELKHEAFTEGPQSINYGNMYRDYGRVAHWWGRTPSEFDALSRQDRVNMVAVYEIEQRIAAMQAYEQRKESERRAKRNTRKNRKRR